jgi:hypothetical protein
MVGSKFLFFLCMINFESGVNFVGGGPCSSSSYFMQKQVFRGLNFRDSERETLASTDYFPSHSILTDHSSDSRVCTQNLNENPETIELYNATCIRPTSQ